MQDEWLCEWAGQVDLLLLTGEPLGVGGWGVEGWDVGSGVQGFGEAMVAFQVLQ